MVGFEGENENRFSQGPPLSLKVTIVMIGSLLLMILDQRFNYVSNIRDALSVITMPLENVAALPGKTIDWASDELDSHEELQDERDRLRKELLQLQARVKDLELLEQQNDELREKLRAVRRQRLKVRLANVVGVSGDAYRYSARVDMGRNKDVYVGQPVIDAHGVVGQVTRVTPFRADITFIIDGDHSTPVKVKRTGARAMADGGHDNGLLIIRNLPVSAEVKKGDVILTSGEGGVFPAGYRVGTVRLVHRDQGVGFARAIVEPAARFDQLEHLLLVWEEKQERPDQPQTPATLAPIGSVNSSGSDTDAGNSSNNNAPATGGAQ